MPMAPATARLVASARWTCVQVITAWIIGFVLVGSDRGASWSIQSDTSLASAAKNAAAVGSLVDRSIGHRVAYIIISRSTGAAARTWARPSVSASMVGSKNTDTDWTPWSVVQCE